MARIGIYGGAFNPPHLGHLRAAEAAREALALDKVLLVPTGESPHKPLPEGSPSGPDRLDLLRLAVGDLPGLEVSDMELRRSGPSYSYETVEALRAEHPDDELYFLMGTDMLLSFRTWREPERILKCAALAVVPRGQKGEKEAIAREKAVLGSMGARVTVIDAPVTAISSTDLRRMLVFRCAGEFLPRDVEAEIEKRGLYGAGRSYRDLPMAELEPVALGLLNPNRVRHVLGCRDTAAGLARRWGADETDAARAGLLHDVTKALDGPLQLTLCRAYGVDLDAFSAQNPKTLHALTGSLVAERIFGEDPAVVSAIRSHTTGKPNMNLLEKILYVADYMEPNRDFPGVERLRELAWSDLDGALTLGLEMTLDVLREQGREISPESQEALRYLLAHKE